MRDLCEIFSTKSQAENHVMHVGGAYLSDLLVDRVEPCQED